MRNTAARRSTTTAATNKRTRKLGASHDRYTYWLGSDLYVYQWDEIKSEWIGWLCHYSQWKFFSGSRAA